MKKKTALQEAIQGLEGLLESTESTTERELILICMGIVEENLYLEREQIEEAHKLGSEDIFPLSGIDFYEQTYNTEE